MSLTRVRKRDGRQVPFDESKIAQAISAAMEAAGEKDVPFATEVAGVVRMTLEATCGEGTRAASTGTRVPTIEEIQDLVEKALVELGRAQVAKVYILHRDRRARVREALEVHAVPSGSGAPVRVEESKGRASWSKGRIVAALMAEADLPRETAESVAARVERRVFESGMRRLTTALIRELVDNELHGMGLATALRRQTSVLFPLHDLRRSFSVPTEQPDLGRPAGPEALGGSALSTRVAGELLRRFALEHVLGEGASQRHRSGDFYVQNLEQPHLYLWTSLSLDGAVERDRSLGGSQPAPSAATAGSRNAFEHLEEWARVAQSTSRGLVLGAAESAVATLTRGSSLDHWLAALAATARAAGRRIDLGFSGSNARSLDLAQRLIVALDQRPPQAAPRLFASVDLIERLPRADGFERCFERALARGSLIPTWSAERQLFAAPGCVRPPRERGPVSCAGAVALNLPRLARRAGPWREDRMLEGLAEIISAAIDACENLHDFQRSVPAARGEHSPPGRARLQFALAPVGLREALRILGDGELRPEQGARLLGFIADASQRMSAAFPFDVALSAFGDERAAQCFSDLDAAARRTNQQLLFGDGAGAESERGQPYSEGFRLTPVPGFTPWTAEAQLCSTISAGALWPLPEEGSRGGIVSVAEACRRFGALRREPPSSAPAMGRAGLDGGTSLTHGPGLFDPSLAQSGGGLEKQPCT